VLTIKLIGVILLDQLDSD